ncbi:Transglycosylase-like domain-containing protein [Pseudonocardia ammonioxydans]|uniref:Transglycosylase-like domain-containing protein n=1 Tax=Pseudonocardia ammonioxydans TaxID=260086 RepID=A0A1I4UGG3_PSUAM|nr:transglycosylase family protein [Pseudonocardia ammonioxydans]SFM88058.1 Transglycosylase-like domain-containing protein [Pseudonocardia ammonioxydans]
MAGRHRKPTDTGRTVARIGVLTAMAAAPLGIVGTASAAASAPSVEKTSTWDQLAQCESTGNWSADTGNGYLGGLQFTESTWQEFGGTQHASSPDQASKSQQIAVAKKVQEQQGWKAWPSCTKELGWR